MLQKINLVIVVLDGSYLLEEHFETISEAYLEPILKHMKQQQIIIEKEDKDKKGEIEKNKITPKLKCGLVVFGNYEPISRSPVTRYYFEENLSQFEKLIAGIEFEDGGMRENAVAEGLVAALEMFDAHKSQMKPENSETIEIIEHCLLISNSHPCSDLVHRNHDEKYDQYSMKQIEEEMKNRKINFSLITPERNFTELEELVAEVNQGVEVHNATDVISSSHVVKLAGFKPPFTKEVSTAQKRKREDSTSSTGTNDQQASSVQSSGNEAKKVKLEQTQEPIKDIKEQLPIPKNNIQEVHTNGQLPVQQPQPLQTLPIIKKDPDTHNPSEHPQSSSQPPVVNTPPAQTTPKLQTSTVSNATTSNTNPTPPQVIQIPPNTPQTQQPVKITAPVQMQLSVPASSTATMSRPPRPTLVTAQRPQLHQQFASLLNGMTPDQRKQYLNSLNPQMIRNNPNIIRNLPMLQQQLLRSKSLHDLQILNQQQLNQQINQQLLNQQISQQLNQQLLNQQLNQQLGLGLPLQNGSQINIGQQQIGNFITSAAPISEAVSTQALNGFIAANAQQLNAFNAQTAPSSNSAAIGYTSASTSAGTISTFGATATNSVQLPVSMNSISAAGINVTGQTAAGVIGQVANGGIRPNHPQKKVNALWSGHIAWSANNNQGQRRELTCQVTAFPISSKKTASTASTAQTSQVDYMISCWPEKMEIFGVHPAKDAISNANTNSNPNPKIVSFLPNPTPNSIENNNTFGGLIRILEERKMAAFVRFPNAPNSQGGIVLFTNGPANAPKLVGLLFLDTPLPTRSAQVMSQGQQQIRPPQVAMPQQLFQLRTQQPMQIQAALQQQKLLHQQQQMANFPQLQQMIQQQQQRVRPMLQNPQAGTESMYRMIRNNNSGGINQQQLAAILQQRQQSQQQPTQ